MSFKEWIKYSRDLGWSHPVHVQGRRALLVAVVIVATSAMGSKTGNDVWHVASCLVFLAWYLTKGPAFEVGRIIGRLEAKIELEQKGKIG